MPDDDDFKGTERFAVISRLGRGGMGSVFHVADRQRNTRLALKTVGHVVGDALLRFKNEFRALQEIDHPNLVTLGELFEHHGEWFFTLELVQGSDFLEYVRNERPADPRYAVTQVADADVRVHAPTMAGDTLPSIQGIASVRENLDAYRLVDPSVGFDEVRLRQALAQLCEGVHALHQQGQVHRDIKPTNILVDSEGRVVLIDFGLAVGMGGDEVGTFRMAGTPAYMAPEQAVEPVTLPASDWYAVGVTLYEALTGRLPFEGTELSIMLRKQAEVPVAPADLVANVPPDLDCLCMDLLSVLPDGRPSGEEVLERLHVQRRSVAPTSRASHSSRSGGFIGRAHELAALERAFDRCRRGAQVVVGITGASGIGKSSLLQRYLERLGRAEGGAVVLRGRCYEQESVPYKAFDGVMDQLSRWLLTMPDDEVDMLLPEHASLLGRVFPVLRRVKRIDEGSFPATPDRLEQRRLVFATVRELFARIRSRHMLVITVDDVQWSDDESRRMFEAITRRPTPPALLLLLTERTDSASEDVMVVSKVEQWFPEVQVLAVGPLSSEESFALVKRHLNESAHHTERLAEVVRHAGGHPLFLEALMRQRSLADAGELRLDLGEVLHEQLGELDELARRLLEVICLAGVPLERAVAGEAAMVEPRLLPQRLRALRVARLLRTSESHPAEAVEPYHSRIREAVLERLELPLQVRHHRELARALEQTGAHPEQIAQHYEAGDLPDRATGYLLRAARRAMDAFAFDQAAGFYRRALQLGAIVADELQAVRVELGHALANAGRGEAAAQAYASALDGASPAQRLDLMRRIAEQLLTAGRYQEGLDASRNALSELGLSLPRSPGAAFRQLVLLRLRLALRGLRFEASNVDDSSARELARIDTCWSLSRGFASHDVVLAQVLQGRALLFALKAGEPTRIARGLCFEYISRAIDGPKALAKQRKLLERAQAIGDEAEDASIRAAVAFADGMGAHTGACDFKTSAPLFEAASGILRANCTDVAWERSLADEQRLIAYFWLGSWREMARDCPELCKHAADVGNLYWLNRFAGSYLSFVAELRDDVAESRRLIQLGEDTLPADTSAIQRFGQLWCATRLDLYEQRWRPALERHQGWHADMLASLVLRVPLVGFTHQFDAARIYLLAAKHDAEQRRAHLKRALEAASKLEHSPIAYGRSLGAAVRGAAAIILGRPEEAIERLESAEAELEANGIESVLTAVRRRRGELLAGTEGGALVATTNRWYLARGVHNPDAMTSMLLP